MNTVVWIVLIHVGYSSPEIRVFRYYEMALMFFSEAIKQHNGEISDEVIEKGVYHRWYGNDYNDYLNISIEEYLVEQVL